MYLILDNERNGFYAFILSESFKYKKVCFILFYIMPI